MISLFLMERKCLLFLKLGQAKMILLPYNILQASEEVLSDTLAGYPRTEIIRKGDNNDTSRF